MRSLKIERKQRQGRNANAARKPSRGPRVSPAPSKSSGKRKTPNVLTRVWRTVQDRVVSGRPMFMLACGVIGLALLAALIVGGYAGRTFHRVNATLTALTDDAGFGISEVHLAGNRRVPPDAILAALGFGLGQSIFDADIQAARRRLEKLDWVASAEVKRRYPDDISVRIVEKLPFALWQSAAGLYVVERDGSIITAKGIEEFVHLPLLIGDGGSNASDIVDAVAQHRSLESRVKAYQRVSQRRWNLILDDGVLVKLPELGWQKELDALEHLIVDKGILERDVSEIDLRSPTQYFFVLRNGERKNEPRGNAA